MTWTYDLNALSVALNKVRLLVGDTDTNDQLIQDEEIAFFISENPSNVYYAAAETAEAIAAKYQSAISSKTADGKSISYEQITNYLSLAAKLRSKATRQRAGLPYAGGTSVADKQTVEADTDRDPTAIELGLHDHADPVSPERVGPTP